MRYTVAIYQPGRGSKEAIKEAVFFEDLDSAKDYYYEAVLNNLHNGFVIKLMDANDVILEMKEYKSGFG